MLLQIHIGMISVSFVWFKCLDGGSLDLSMQQQQSGQAGMFLRVCVAAGKIVQHADWREKQKKKPS